MIIYHWTQHLSTKKLSMLKFPVTDRWANLQRMIYIIFYVTFCVANLFQYCAQISLNLCANMGLLAGKIIASGSIVLEM